MTSLAGSFLIARPVLQDPNFHQSVVLLLQHGAEGAFGLVVNRATKVDSLPFPVYQGGPCSSEGFMMVHGHEDWIEPSALPLENQVAPGLFLGDAESFRKVTDNDSQSELRFRVFAGYSGWGPDQLENEMVTGAWAVTPASAELLFDTPPDELWQKLVPPSFPQPSIN
jgi:putative transcriptional regulator